MKKLIVPFLLLLTAAGFYSKTLRTTDLADIIDTASKKPELAAFVSALALAELTDNARAQKPPAPFTVFAPNQAAFAAAALAQNKEAMRPVMKFHVVPGKNLPKDQLVPGQLESISGNKIEVLTGGQVKGANETATIAESLPCSNGILHIIDKVLTPTKE
jgi:uncharacterized surface protein with fasciclin (FAS1) repeats